MRMQVDAPPSGAWPAPSALHRHLQHDDSYKSYPVTTTSNSKGRGVVTVVPDTSNTERVYPFQVLLDAADTGPAQA